MGTLEGFERKGLFRFTRFVGILIVCVLMAGFIAGVIVFGGTLFADQNSRVNPQAVLDKVRPPATAAESTGTEVPANSNVLPGVKLPFVLQPYFSDPAHRRILLSRIEDLSPEQQQEYVDNLAEVLQEAKAQKVDVTEAINEYFQQKSEAMSRASVRKNALIQSRLYVVGAAVSILALIALFSLILVLLAIERNTRTTGPLGREAMP